MGSGAAGLVAAVRAADAGLSVAGGRKGSPAGRNHRRGRRRDVGAEQPPGQGRAGYATAMPTASPTSPRQPGTCCQLEEIDWYVSTAPRAVDYLTANTRVSMTPDRPPGLPHGVERSGRRRPRPGQQRLRSAGTRACRRPIRPSSYFPLLTMTERDGLNGRAADPGAAARSGPPPGVRTMGGALVGRLLASALDRGVHIAAGTAR